MERDFITRKVEGFELIFIEEGRLRLGKYYDGAVLDFDKGLLTEGNETERNSNSIRIDLSKGFISEVDGDLIIDFQKENLQDNRLKDPGESINIILLNDEGNILRNIWAEAYYVDEFNNRYGTWKKLEKEV